MKLTEKQAGIFARALEKWGKPSQILIALEEMSELQKEVIKNLRGQDNIDSIAEEMADVYVTLEQIRRIYDIEDGKIQKIADEKIDRLEKRIDGGYDMKRMP